MYQYLNQKYSFIISTFFYRLCIHEKYHIHEILFCLCLTVQLISDIRKRVKLFFDFVRLEAFLGNFINFGFTNVNQVNVLNPLVSISNAIFTIISVPYGLQSISFLTSYYRIFFSLLQVFYNTVKIFAFEANYQSYFILSFHDLISKSRAVTPLSPIQQFFCYFTFPSFPFTFHVQLCVVFSSEFVSMLA